MPNTVSSQVGVGADHNYYGRNGFLNPRPPVRGFGPYRNGYRRSGVAVGVLPVFPYYGAGYGSYDGFYDDSGAPYPYDSSSVDPGQASGYDGPGPYVDQAPYPPQYPGPTASTPPPYWGYQAPAPVAPDAQAPVPPMPPVTIVFRNGQQMTIQNFAVADGFFWDFSKAVPRKIPIASIDLAASAKATQANGGEFPDLSPVPDDSAN